jgi:hypothetical protein
MLYQLQDPEEREGLDSTGVLNEGWKYYRRECGQHAEDLEGRPQYKRGKKKIKSNIEDWDLKDWYWENRLLGRPRIESSWRGKKEMKEMRGKKEKFA